MSDQHYKFLSQQIDDAKTVLTTVMSFFGFGFSFYYSRLYQDNLLATLATVLFLATALRNYLYFSAVREELDIYREIVDQTKLAYIPGARNIKWIVIGLSGSMACMMVSSSFISAYCLLATLFAMVDVHGNCQNLHTLGKIILTGRHDHKATPEYRKVTFDYYFGRPLALRAALVLVGFGLAFFVACTALLFESNHSLPYFISHLSYKTFQGAPQVPTARLLTIVAYSIAIATILISELVIGQWRGHFDKERRRVLDTQTNDEDESAMEASTS